MPMYNKSGIAAEASKHGFQRDVFEKVLRLKTVLDYFQEEPALREHLLLKGGTAINLTVFSLPRLSVDIDMDYMIWKVRDINYQITHDLVIVWMRFTFCI